MNSFQEFITDVKNANDISSVIGEVVPITNKKACCPFHDEHEASFSINIEEQYCHCFGCNEGGDVIWFVQKIMKIGFKEAVVFLAKRAGIAVPEGFLNEVEGNEKILKQDILKEAAGFYHKQADQFKEYLKERGFDPSVLGKYMIGYADGKLKEYLLKKCEFPLQTCLDSGLLKEDAEGNIVDFFQKRIIFPHYIHDTVVNMTGRALDDSEPRYLHLPGTKKHMYNENSLKENKVIHLVEGIFDALALEVNGFRSVAILGTQGFKNEYLDKFSKCSMVYVCMDGDSAGVKAAEEIAGKIGEKAKIISLPDNLDPAEYFINHEPADFEKLISGAKGYVQYLLDKIPEDTSLLEIGEKINPLLSYLSRCSEETAEAHLKESIKSHFTNIDRDYLALMKKKIRDLRKKVKPVAENVNFEEEPAEPAAVFENLVDIVFYDDKNQFLILENGSLSICESYALDGKTVSPPQPKDMPWFNISDGSEVIKSYQQMIKAPQHEISRLLDDIVSYLHDVSDLPDSRFYTYLGGWVMHTYLQELIDYSPIIGLFSTPAKGKSRTGKGLVYISFRGVAMESLNTAYIFRLAQNFGATIFFDLMDVWKKAEKLGAEDILLCRFEKGQYVARVIYPEKGPYKDTVFYPIFGPTIIGTNKELGEILGTRCTEINMKESNKIFNITVTPKLGATLRIRLLAFRALCMHTPLIEMEKPFRGRLGDIVKPIFQIMRLANPAYESDLISLITDIQNARSIAESETTEAKIFAVIIELKNKVESNSKGALLSINEIRAAYWKKYEVIPGSKFPTNQHIGNLCTSLGFSKDPMSNSRMGIHWDESLIENLCIRYNKSNPCNSVDTVPALKGYCIAEKSISSNSEHIILVDPENSKGSKGFKDISGCIPEEKHAHTGADKNYRIIRDLDTLNEAIKEIYEAGFVSVDTETTSKKPREAQLVGISFSTKANSGWFIRVNDGCKQYLDEYWDKAILIPLLKPVLEDQSIDKICQNIKYDIVVLSNAGINLAGKIFDTLIASKILYPDKNGHDMDTLAMDYLNYKTTTFKELVGKGKITDVDIESLADYAIEDADITYQLFCYFKEQLKKDTALLSLYQNIEEPLIPVLCDVELQGIKLDMEHFTKLGITCDSMINGCVASIHSAAGRKFNINSTKELPKVLYDELGLTRYTTTKKGKDSSGAETLEMLKGMHPIIESLIKYRTLNKLKTTYIDTLPKQAKPVTGRVHTVFNQLGALTGRMSSMEPNLQNIPARDSDGINIRHGFIAETGHLLMAADYSQIELRVAAHLSQDPLMVDAFIRGDDIHSITASIVNGVDLDKVTPEMRRQAKVVNFGVIYGMSSYGLSKELGISQFEAEQYIQAFFNKYNGFKQFIDSTIVNAQKTGFVSTLYGRKRAVEGINSNDPKTRVSTERIAVNSPIQGTAADLIKMAMINIHRRLKEGNYATKMILQIHDELLFEVPDSEKEQVEDLVRVEMEGVAQLAIPLVVDIAWGKNWEEAHK